MYYYCAIIYKCRTFLFVFVKKLDAVYNDIKNDSDVNEILKIKLFYFLSSNMSFFSCYILLDINHLLWID